MYAEELYFTPKYVKAKEMADQGAFGKVYLSPQGRKGRVAFPSSRSEASDRFVEVSGLISQPTDGNPASAIATSSSL